MDQKQTALLTVFTAYVACIPIFGAAYFVLYRRSHSHFVFAADVFRTRVDEERRKIADRILWLRRLLYTFEQVARDHGQSVGPQEGTKPRATLHLSDGRLLVLEENRPPMPLHAGAQPPVQRVPTVRMLRGDGTEEWKSVLYDYGSRWEFADWAGYLSAALAQIKEDLQSAEAQDDELDSSSPKIWRYLDFMYFSAITQSTVGYGDILPNSTVVRTFVIAQVVLAYGLFVVVLNLVLSAK